MWLVSDPANLLPRPHKDNMLRVAKVASTMSYKGEFLLGRMITRSHPDHDLPVEDLAARITETVSRIEERTPPPNTFVPLGLGHSLMEASAYVVRMTHIIKTQN